VGDPTNPGSRDSDGDGISDAEELNPPSWSVVTDPNDPDSDDDGVPDGQDGLPLDKVVFYHGDHLGSITVLTNTEGTELARVLYKPFGETVEGTAPEFGFTGQRFEGSFGIYDYGARFYDPELGRFLNADSEIPEAGDPQSLNRYSYVRNNPVNRVDPTGNFDWDEGPSLWDFFEDVYYYGSAFGLSGAFEAPSIYLGETVTRQLGLDQSGR
jgi:RHS repeat-associated protein